MERERQIKRELLCENSFKDWYVDLMREWEPTPKKYE